LKRSQVETYYSRTGKSIEGNFTQTAGLKYRDRRHMSWLLGVECG
jgi:hypothetical protein